VNSLAANIYGDATFAWVGSVWWMAIIPSPQLPRTVTGRRDTNSITVISGYQFYRMTDGNLLSDGNRNFATTMRTIDDVWVTNVGAVILSRRESCDGG